MSNFMKTGISRLLDLRTPRLDAGAGLLAIFSSLPMDFCVGRMRRAGGNRSRRSESSSSGPRCACWIVEENAFVFEMGFMMGGLRKGVDSKKHGFESLTDAFL